MIVINNTLIIYKIYFCLLFRLIQMRNLKCCQLFQVTLTMPVDHTDLCLQPILHLSAGDTDLCFALISVHLLPQW